MTLTGQAATAYDYRTAKESLARIRLFIDEAMGGMWGPECETEAHNVLAEYEIVADRIERLATNKARADASVSESAGARLQQAYQTGFQDGFDFCRDYPNTGYEKSRAFAEGKANHYVDSVTPHVEPMPNAPAPERARFAALFAKIEGMPQINAGLGGPKLDRSAVLAAIQEEIDRSLTPHLEAEPR